MTAACFFGTRPALAVAWARAASKRSMWRRVAVSENASAVLDAAPSAFTRRPAIGSAVEEDGFVRAADMDRQAPDARTVALGDQRRSARRIDQLQHRILCQRRIAVEIETRREAIEHTAREDGDVDVRRLHAARRPRHPARLHGREMRLALGVGRGTAEAFEARVERQVTPVVGMVVAAMAVGLPDLEQPVGDQYALGVEQREHELDALARDARWCEIGVIGVDQRAPVE